MRISHIVPTAFVPEFGIQGDFILALSHLIELDRETDYEKAIKATGLEIILDNGLFENSVPESLETLVQKALKVGASTFFAPDVLFDTEKTQESLEQTIILLEQMKNDPKYRFEKGLKIGAVVQADNEADYLKQLVDFNNNPNVDLIGLSILSVPKSFKGSEEIRDITASRVSLLMRMKEMEKTHGIVWKNCHLLGLGSSFEDVLHAIEFCPFVVSNDTSCCFQNGLRAKLLDHKLRVGGGKTPEKVEFDLKELPVGAHHWIQHNINQVKNLIK